MGVKRPGESDSEIATVTEADLSGLDDVGADFGATAGPVVADDKEAIALSPQDLDHLAPGCFVRFGRHGMRCWLEIGRIDGNFVSGKLRAELSDPICVIEYCHTETVSIRRDEITALGCERYCWC